MPELRVLFVTSRVDGPFRYRCRHGCEQLRAEGAVANVLHVRDPRLLGELERYSVVVLFRLPWSPETEAVVDAARRVGLPLVFDVDDLVFDPAAESLIPFRRNYTAVEWRSSYGQEIAAVRRTLDACDLFIASTPALVEHAGRLGKRGAVHPNVVSNLYLRRGRQLLRARHLLRSAPTLGYFSGSNTHDDDFEAIAPAVARVLGERPDVRLLLGGYLELGTSLAGFEARVSRLPYMSWRDYACAYAACTVNLAPLVEVNDFADGKSALKFFEAGAFFTPTVASPSRPMRDAIREGETGYLAENLDDWYRALCRALDPATSNEVGAAARNAVEEGHSFASVRGRLRALLEPIAVRAAGKPPRPTPLDMPENLGRPPLFDQVARPFTFLQNLSALLHASRERPDPAPDAERVARLLDLMVTDRAARRELTLRGAALVLQAPDVAEWSANEQLSLDAPVPGEWRSTGPDPAFQSGKVSVDPRSYRYLVARLRVSVRAPRARAQLYWRRAGERDFEEACSIAWPVATDGCDQTYIVDLARSPGWRRRATIVETLRLDPLDRPGTVRLSAVLLLGARSHDLDGTDLTLPDSAPVPASDKSLALPDDLDAALRVLSRALASCADSGRVVAVSRRPAGEVRRALEKLTGAVVEEIAHTAGGGTRIALRKRTDPTERAVDIVVPVYNALSDTLRCLESVLRHATGSFRLVVIDDASPDPDVWPALERMKAKSERIVLLRNEHNLGFVGTSNRGIAQAGDRDVLLLNSDTEVYRDFLERLRLSAYSDPKIGIVTPLSNNATICSVPDFCKPNDLPPGLSGAEMAALVAETSLKLRPDLVTPVGFCMYVKAALLQAIGPFDEELFGRGFGEENDLGERAKLAGWRIACADDVYVYHKGKGSFGAGGVELESKNAPILERRHPGYHAAVASFVKKNPLSPVHENIQRHLERRSDKIEPALLEVLHATPFSEERGGVEHCVRDLVATLSPPRALFTYPTPTGIEVAEVFSGDVSRARRYEFPLRTIPPRFCLEHPEASEVFAELLELFNVGWVHVHHLMFWPLEIGEVLRRSGLPYVITVHDHYWACPSYNLLDHRSLSPCCPSSCGDSARTAACQRALHANLGLPVPRDPARYVSAHRDAMSLTLRGARAVTVPSESTGRLLRSILGSVAEPLVVPHGYDLPRGSKRDARETGPLRVALVGEVAYAPKGAAAYLETMKRCRGANVEWHVFGRTDRFGFDRELDALDGVRIVRHGGYRREDISSLLNRAGIDLGLLLPAWPETFSYTLSEILGAGIPVVAARVGALEDRLRDKPYGRLVDGPSDAAENVRFFAENLAALEPLRTAAATYEHDSPSAWAARYRALYDDCAAASPAVARSVTPEQAARLHEIHHELALSIPAATAVTEPDPNIAQTRLYRYANRMKGFAPESVRQVVRHRLTAQRARVVRRFRLPGKGTRIGGDLVLEKRYFGTSRFTALSGDPHLLVDVPALDPREIDLVRFNLWCSQPGYVFSQFYWRHEGQDDFSEDQSVTVALDGRAAVWQEYAVRLDRDVKNGSWYEGGSIVALRFDPINVPGLVCLGELALCKTQ